MLHGLDDAVGGTRHHGQTIAQTLRIGRLMVCRCHEIQGIGADDLIQPLGFARVDGDAVIACAAGKDMVAGAAAVNQTVHDHTVVGRIAVFMVCAPAGAGILDHRRTAGVDLAALDFLAQIGGNILNQCAAHRNIKALLAAADRQHRNIQRDGLLHEVQVGGIAGIVPAGRAVRVSGLAIERRVPVLAARHKDAVHTGQNGFCGVCVGDLGQIHGIRTVPLKGLSKALIVAADGILLPRNAHRRAAADLGNGHRRDRTVAVQNQIGGDGLAERPVPGLGAEDQRRLIGGAHGLFQLGDRGDAVERLVLHDRLSGDSRFIDHIVFQISVGVHRIQDGRFDLLAGADAVFSLCCKSRHREAEQHQQGQRNAGQPLGCRMGLTSVHDWFLPSFCCPPGPGSHSPAAQSFPTPVLLSKRRDQKKPKATLDRFGLLCQNIKTPLFCSHPMGHRVALGVVLVHAIDHLIHRIVRRNSLFGIHRPEEEHPGQQQQYQRATHQLKQCEIFRMMIHTRFLFSYPNPAAQVMAPPVCGFVRKKPRASPALGFIALCGSYYSAAASPSQAC